MKKKWKPKKQRSHDWFQISRGCPYQFCGRCGIINLNNKATLKVINKPCQGLEEEDTV